MLQQLILKNVRKSYFGKIDGLCTYSDRYEDIEKLKNRYTV